MEAAQFVDEFFAATDDGNKAISRINENLRDLRRLLMMNHRSGSCTTAATIFICPSDTAWFEQADLRSELGFGSHYETRGVIVKSEVGSGRVHAEVVRIW